MVIDKEKDQKNVTHIYAALAASLVMELIPLTAIQIFGTILFLAVLIYAYVLRAKSEENSLCKNHMIYIIRSIWIWSLFFSIGASIATVWILYAGDHTILQNTVDSIMQGKMVTEKDLADSFGAYMKANLPLLISVCTITIGPSILYIVYRLSKGLSRAAKGHRIGNVKAWF